MDTIDKIFKNSAKAELLELLAEKLETTDKVIIVLIQDENEEAGEYSSLVMTLGLKTTYEAYGILDVAKQDLQDNNSFQNLTNEEFLYYNKNMGRPTKGIYKKSKIVTFRLDKEVFDRLKKNHPNTSEYLRSRVTYDITRRHRRKGQT